LTGEGFPTWFIPVAAKITAAAGIYLIVLSGELESEQEPQFMNAGGAIPGPSYAAGGGAIPGMVHPGQTVGYSQAPPAQQPLAQYQFHGVAQQPVSRSNVPADQVMYMQPGGYVPP